MPSLGYNYVVVALPALVVSLFAGAFTICLRSGLLSQPDAATAKVAGHGRMTLLASQIRSGARQFLRTEYYYLLWFVLALGIVLLIMFSLVGYVDRLDGVRSMLAFWFGAALSGYAGWFGMETATAANERTTVARIKGGVSLGLKVAFRAGAVMGFAVVGLGLFGVSLMFILLTFRKKDYVDEYSNTCTSLASFGFGASAIALFARVAGGIYTKAADVGADLVGKVESGIDEDDPHNPATIADNVGDNVGDVAGMGADLFESYVGSIIAAATLAITAADTTVADEKVKLAFMLPAIGIVCSTIGYFAVSTKAEGKGW